MTIYYFYINKLPFFFTIHNPPHKPIEQELCIFFGTGLVGSWINGHGHPFPIPILPIWPYLIDSYFQPHIYTKKKVMPTRCAIKTMSWHVHFARVWNFNLLEWLVVTYTSSFEETPGTKTKKKLILFSTTTWQRRIE